MFVFLSNATTDGKSLFGRKPRISVCVPSGATEVEKKAVEDATYQAVPKSIPISVPAAIAKIPLSLSLMEVLNELQESARAYKTYDEWFVYMERYKKEMDDLIIQTLPVHVPFGPVEYRQ